MTNVVQFQSLADRLEGEWRDVPGTEFSAAEIVFDHHEKIAFMEEKIKMGGLPILEQSTPLTLLTYLKMLVRDIAPLFCNSRLHLIENKSEDKTLGISFGFHAMQGAKPAGDDLSLWIAMHDDEEFAGKLKARKAPLFKDPKHLTTSNWCFEQASENCTLSERQVNHVLHTLRSMASLNGGECFQASVSGRDKFMAYLPYSSRNVVLVALDSDNFKLTQKL